MQISLPQPTDIAPPRHWRRWWSTALTSIERPQSAPLDIWHESWIAQERTLMGNTQARLSYAGESLAAAIEAARALTETPVEIKASVRGARARRLLIQPAVAVLHDAPRGTFWLAPLRTTMRLGATWIDAPATVDPIRALDGTTIIIDSPNTVRASSPSTVAIVGASRVVTPTLWADAPDDARDTADSNLDERRG
jgi:hypothetical protein